MSVILRVRTWQCQLHWDSCEGIYWKQRCLEIQVTVHHKHKVGTCTFNKNNLHFSLAYSITF